MSFCSCWFSSDRFIKMKKTPVRSSLISHEHSQNKREGKNDLARHDNFTRLSMRCIGTSKSEEIR